MIQLEHGGHRYPIPVGGLVVGSDPGCGLRLEGPGVQPRHAVLEWTRTGSAVVRRGSAEAEVLVNGIPLGPEPAPVLDGDRISIGGRELVASDEPTAAPPPGAEQRLDHTMAFPVPSGPWAAPQGAPQGAPRAPAPAASLFARSGALRGQRFPVRGRTADIGSAEHNDVVIPDPAVSPVHARLERRQGVWILMDLGSSEGTYVDGERITGEIPLGPGVTIALGELALLFEPRDERADLEPRAPQAVPGATPAPEREPVPGPATVMSARRGAPKAPGLAAAAPKRSPVSRWVIGLALLAAAVAAALFLSP